MNAGLFADRHAGLVAGVVEQAELDALGDSLNSEKFVPDAVPRRTERKWGAGQHGEIRDGRRRVRRAGYPGHTEHLGAPIRPRRTRFRGRGHRSTVPGRIRR